MTNSPASPTPPDPASTGATEGADDSQEMTRKLVEDVAAYEVDPPPPARATEPRQP